MQKGGGRKRYKADRAEERKNLARKQSKRTVLKVCKNEYIKNFVLKTLKKHWSPERISGSLKRQKVPVSTKAIYKYVYEYNLEKYLFWHILQKKKESISSTSFVKDDRKYIEERPVIHTRGHYEMDFIVSGKTKTCLLVIVDKITRRVSINKLKDRKKLTICRVVKKNVHNPQSITIDNDIVFQQ
jgi:IS30 family transposase